MAIGDADLHRMVKEMVKAETANSKDLTFSKAAASILLKDFDKTIKSRAIFVLIELIENEKTTKLVLEEVKENKAQVLKMAKIDKSTGLQILAKKLV